MSGVWLWIEPDKHVCQKPQIVGDAHTTFGPGSKWQCDGCGAVWKIKRWSTPGGWDMLTPEWEQVP